MEKKDKKKKEIVSNAAEVFLNRGLFNTVMDNIAEKCEITRRTLYRYFDTKEDIAYEVTILLLNDWNDYQKDAYKNLKGTGIEQLEIFLTGLINHMSNKRSIMAYLGEFDFYFKDGSHLEPSAENIRKFNLVSFESEDLIKSIVEEGIKDGSIKPNINVDLTVATISSVLWGFGQRIAIRGHILESETGFDAIELIKNQIEIYIMALRRN